MTVKVLLPGVYITTLKFAHLLALLPLLWICVPPNICGEEGASIEIWLLGLNENCHSPECATGCGGQQKDEAKPAEAKETPIRWGIDVSEKQK